MPNEFIQLLSKADAWLCEGRQVAIVSVVKTWGSSPRPAGSLMVVAEDGDFVGSVSGGCIEGAVLEQAQRTAADGLPRFQFFAVGNDRAWEVGLSCGGSLEVLIEQAQKPMLDEIRQALLARQSRVYVTEIRHLYPFSVKCLVSSPQDERVPLEAVEAVRLALLHGQPLTVWFEERKRFFVQPFVPSARLLVFGAVHIAQSLCKMAAMCGYEVTLIDPRTAFATPQRFPEQTLCTDWPTQAFLSHPVDEHTAVVTLTHDPKLDDPALEEALHKGAFYVGALGSRKTHEARLKRLSDRGFLPEVLARIAGPVGLPINARSPSEIAVAILAQLIEARWSMGGVL